MVNICLNFTVILYTMNIYNCSFASSQYLKNYFLKNGLKTKFLIPVSVLIVVLYVHGHCLFSILCIMEQLITHTYTHISLCDGCLSVLSHPANLTCLPNANLLLLYEPSFTVFLENEKH